MIASDILFFSKVIVSTFIGVLFTQSGFDKIIDFKGNKEYIKSVFEKTFLNRYSTLLLTTITLMEVAAGLLCLFGAIALIFGSKGYLSVLGLKMAMLALLGLFAGQRIAKDYPGAASLVSYFSLAVVGLIIMGL